MAKLSKADFTKFKCLMQYLLAKVKISLGWKKRK